MSVASIRTRRAPVLMLQPSSEAWWCWLACALLLTAAVAGDADAAWMLGGVALWQVAFFRLQERRWRAFPVQVRIGYVAVLAAAAVEPTHLLVWVPAIGTWAQVLFGYCLLARALSLAPWNRAEPLTAAAVWRTFVARPVRGSVLQGQPPLDAAPTR